MKKLIDFLGQIPMRHILHQQYDAVGSHTVQETKHNPNPNPVMNYAKAAALMVVGRLCNGTLVARKCV